MCNSSCSRDFSVIMSGLANSLHARRRLNQLIVQILLSRQSALGTNISRGFEHLADVLFQNSGIVAHSLEFEGEGSRNARACLGVGSWERVGDEEG